MAKEESLVPFIYVLMLWQIPKTCNIKRENPYCSSIFMPFVNPPKERKKSISANLNFEASTIQKAITWVLKVSKKALDYLFKVLQYFFRVRYDPRSRLRLFMFFWKIRFWWKWRWSYMFCLWSDTAAFVFLITYSPYRVFSFGLGVQAKPSRSRMMAQHRSSRVM